MDTVMSFADLEKCFISSFLFFILSQWPPVSPGAFQKLPVEFGRLRVYQKDCSSLTMVPGGFMLINELREFAADLQPNKKLNNI